MPPLTFKLPEVAAVNVVNPRTTEEVVARGPWCSFASTTFSSKYKAPSSARQKLQQITYMEWLVKNKINAEIVNGLRSFPFGWSSFSKCTVGNETGKRMLLGSKIIEIWSKQI